MSWYLQVLKKYATFQGRARRKEFWMFTLYNTVFALATLIIGILVGKVLKNNFAYLLFVAYILAILVPSIACGVRRLHDIGKSGALIFINLVPVIGSIWFLILMFKQGITGDNNFGEDPKASISVSTLAKWQSKKQNQKTIFLIFAVVPSMIGYVTFDLYPNVLSIWYSLLEWNGVKDPVFVGLRNYIQIFNDPNFWNASFHSLIMLLTFPICVIVLSLLLSYALANKSYPEFKVHQNIFFVPNVLSSVIIALIFTFLYDGSFGLINKVLTAVGLNSFADFYWLGDTRTALGAIILAMIWGGVGFYLIIFMNAMKGVPKSIYESAILDGASSMVRLFKITVPLIWPVIKVSLLFLMIGSIKTYEIVYVLGSNNGIGMERSTDVLGLYMFNWAFGNVAAGTGESKLGYASAIGMIMFVILVGSKLVTDKFTKKDSVEY